MSLVRELAGNVTLSATAAFTSNRRANHFGLSYYGALCVNSPAHTD